MFFCARRRRKSIEDPLAPTLSLCIALDAPRVGNACVYVSRNLYAAVFLYARMIGTQSGRDAQWDDLVLGKTLTRADLITPSEYLMMKAPVATCASCQRLYARFNEFDKVNTPRPRVVALGRVCVLDVFVRMKVQIAVNTAGGNDDDAMQSSLVFAVFRVSRDVVIILKWAHSARIKRASTGYGAAVAVAGAVGFGVVMSNHNYIYNSIWYIVENALRRLACLACILICTAPCWAPSRVDHVFVCVFPCTSLIYISVYGCSA